MPDFESSLSTQDRMILKTILERFDALSSRVDAFESRFHTVTDKQTQTINHRITLATTQHHDSRLFRALRFFGLLGVSQ